MALKPSKITSEFIVTCNRFLSSNPDTTLRSKIPVKVTSQKDLLKNQTAFRYQIETTQKKERLPELNFQEEPSVLFAELQPAANPEFRFHWQQPKWAEKLEDKSPFPSSIRQPGKLHLIYTDKQKAEDKMLQCKMNYLKPSVRRLSMMPSRIYCKAPAENSGSGQCIKPIDKCVTGKAKVCKIVNKDCPRHRLDNCEQAKGSNCKLNYLDPHCTKKFAPYPSYSESCAEDFPEDPSECQQCPWRTCDGADTIEPGKPVRNKRNYSTSCSRHLETTSGVVGCSALPPTLVDVQEHLCHGNCGQTKGPCKQPKGPCEVRKEKEDQQKREKAIHIPPKPKKASEDILQLVLTCVPDGHNQNMLLNPYSPQSKKLTLDQPLIGDQNSWLDITEGGEGMFLDKKPKPPHCQHKQKPKRPKGTNIDELVKTEMSLCKKKQIKGDEGHPPPCEEKGSESLNCPTKPLKKPKYKKKPMYTGYYKKDS